MARKKITTQDARQTLSLASEAAHQLKPLPIRFYALYSGGKDSTVAASVLEDADMLAGVVAIDTGIKDPEWEPFITSECKRLGWALTVYRTDEKYFDLVRKYGFPGPGMHSTFMNYLKGRGIRKFKKEHPGEALASGVRKYESKRRRFTTKLWSIREGVPIFAPIFEWTDAEVWDYFTGRNYKKAPAYEKLCISGDCLCGAFASPEEPTILQEYYPTVWKEIESVQNEIGDQWGRRSIKGRKRKRRSDPLCIDCDKQGELF